MTVWSDKSSPGSPRPARRNERKGQIMGMSLGGIGANFNIATRTSTSTAKSGQSATPAFAHNHTWGSIAEMEQAFRSYGKEWRGVYSSDFAGSGANGDGKLTQEELNALLESEFGGLGATFVDSAPKDVTVGKHQIYIDEKNRQKMANDPEFRAQVFSVIQIEMAGSRGYSVQGPGGPTHNRLTGSALSISEGDPLYEGVPHSGMATGEPTMTQTTTTSGGAPAAAKAGKTKKSKSMLEIIKEKLEEKLEKKREEEKLKEAKQAREDMVEISAEAGAKAADAVEEKLAAEAEAAKPGEAEQAGGGLDILA